MSQNAERWKFGWCYFFAAAMHRATGCSIGAVSGIRRRAKRPRIAHAWAVSSDGVMIDASGEISREEVMETFFEDHLGQECRDSATFMTFRNEAEFVSWLCENEPDMEDHIRECFAERAEAADAFVSDFLSSGQFPAFLENASPSP